MSSSTLWLRNGVHLHKHSCIQVGFSLKAFTTSTQAAAGLLTPKNFRPLADKHNKSRQKPTQLSSSIFRKKIVWKVFCDFALIFQHCGGLVSIHFKWESVIFTLCTLDETQFFSYLARNAIFWCDGRILLQATRGAISKSGSTEFIRG